MVLHVQWKISIMMMVAWSILDWYFYQDALGAIKISQIASVPKSVVVKYCFARL